MATLHLVTASRISPHVERHELLQRRSLKQTMVVLLTIHADAPTFRAEKCATFALFTTRKRKDITRARFGNARILSYRATRAAAHSACSRNAASTFMGASFVRGSSFSLCHPRDRRTTLSKGE